MRKPLVMGNWKLNSSREMATTLVSGIKNELSFETGCDVAIAPPSVYLDFVKNQLAGSKLILAAQDTGINISGAHTGDVSPAMLKDIGVTHVIIGHSERRTNHKESDELVAKKFAVLKETGLVPVLCIGETEAENESGLTEKVCAKQIDAVFNLLGPKAFDGAVIAYEPVWAIGTGKSATPEQAQAVHHFIRQHLTKQDASIASNVIIQYGGSVNDKNAAELFAKTDIDGALVGGASLKADSFSVIAKAAAKAKR